MRGKRTHLVTRILGKDDEWLVVRYEVGQEAGILIAVAFDRGTALFLARAADILAAQELAELERVGGTIEERVARAEA